MKRALSLLVLIAAASSAQANSIQTIFKPSSVLPTELQSELYTYLLTHCSEYVIPYGLKETDTSVMAKDFDNGTVYYGYTTTLTSVYYFDGFHPDTADIVAKTSRSVKMDGSSRISIGQVLVNGSECQ
ncbi:MAG: hypothetical protein ACJ763_12565 [Bdellovibrionia bacterium]